MVNDSKPRSFPTGKGLSDQVIIQGSYTVSRECGTSQKKVMI